MRSEMVELKEVVYNGVGFRAVMGYCRLLGRLIGCTFLVLFAWLVIEAVKFSYGYGVEKGEEIKQWVYGEALIHALEDFDLNLLELGLDGSGAVILKRAKDLDELELRRALAWNLHRLTMKQVKLDAIREMVANPDLND